MADRHTAAQRSFNMSRIRGKNTKPEMLVRQKLFAAGFRYRLNVKNLPGKPDLVFKKYKTAVFIHGCFWHGHEHCRYFVVPKTRTDFWMEKINGNVKRDHENERKLHEAGWQILTVWECQLKKNLVDESIEQLKEKIKGNVPGTAG